MQILGSLSGFIEGSSEEIGSGWRPLFGALKAAHSFASLQDAFMAFFHLQIPLVFANASLDSILCLLKHILSASKCRTVHNYNIS